MKEKSHSTKPEQKQKTPEQIYCEYCRCLAKYSRDVVKDEEISKDEAEKLMQRAEFLEMLANHPTFDPIELHNIICDDDVMRCSFLWDILFPETANSRRI